MVETEFGIVILVKELHHSFLYNTDTQLYVC